VISLKKQPEQRKARMKSANADTFVEALKESKANGKKK